MSTDATAARLSASTGPEQPPARIRVSRIAQIGSEPVSEVTR